MVEGDMQDFLGAKKLTESDWFIATRTDPARTNLSHEASALTALLAKEAYATGRALVDCVGLSGLRWQKLGDLCHKLMAKPVCPRTTGVGAGVASPANW